MERLSSHLLLSIFKWLDSVQVVKIMSVCQMWSEIIEENGSLWRRPVLPKRKIGWNSSRLELFDRKSRRSLEEVSISLFKEGPKEPDLLAELLGRSKRSLRFLSIQFNDIQSFLNSQSSIYDLSWILPRLTELRISFSDQERRSRVSLKWNEVQVSNGFGSDQDLSNLKVLWGWEFSVLFESHLHLLNNITSLSVSRALESSEWRRILEVPSKTLKHLRMRAWASPGSDRVRLSTLHFPRLKVLQTWSSRSSVLPTWLSVPTTSILISEVNLPLYLPSVSTLCIPHLRDIQRLKSRCPLLAELEVGERSDELIAEIFPELVNQLISVLEERKQQSEEGFEVDGVQITSLKKLVIPLEDLNAEQLEGLRSLVEEVIDLESVSPFIEIEV